MKDNLDPRTYITVKDLKKCMDKLAQELKFIGANKVKLHHPGIKKAKNVVPTFIEFEMDRKNKNVKLLDDVVIVLKY